MNIGYPFHFDSRGRSATIGDEDHIRDLIEQFLFTSPGSGSTGLTSAADCCS